MKNVFYFWICMAVWLLSACSSQKKGDGEDVQVLMKDSVDANGLQRMQVSDSKMSFTYNGKEYHSHVVRRPDDSLPVVTNEQGEKFVDNRITLRITSGGKSIVNKEFTKESFASLVDAKFLKHSSKGMVYAASICYPQSDLYIPLSITVSADGKISIAKEELLEEVYETDSI